MENRDIVYAREFLFHGKVAGIVSQNHKYEKKKKHFMIVAVYSFFLFF